MEDPFHPGSDTAYPNFSPAACPSNAPFRNPRARSPSSPRLGNYSSAAGHEHGVDSSDSNPSSSQSAGKEISDQKRLRPTQGICVYPGCDRQFARTCDLSRHMKVHFPDPTTKQDCPYAAEVGSFCKRVGERGFTRKDHWNEHLRRVHMVDMPKSSRGMPVSLNDNPPSKGKIEQHSKKDTTNMSALTTVVEPQQDQEWQPKLEGDFNDEALTASSSGSSNPKKYAFSNNETGSKLTRLTSISDVAMIPAVRDSRDMTGVASQLTSECVAKEAFKVQPSDTPLDGVVLGSQIGIVPEQQTLSRACNVSDAPLPGSRKIGHGSHPSGHEGAEKPHSALEGQVANEEASFDSAVFHLNHQEYRKAEEVLQQLLEIHKNGDSTDYQAKLCLLLAKAYQGQSQLEKAKGFASASLYVRKYLHGKTHPLVEESAELLIAIMEADALRKIHCPRRSYTAAFIGLAMKVGTMANPLRCSMISRRSLSILEHIQQWFLNSNLLSWLVGTVFPEKPLAAGKTRVRWTCSCGQRLFDDFIETRPGAAEELRVALDTFDRQRPTSHYPAYPAASYQSYSGSTNRSGNPTRDSATSPAGAVNPNFTPPRSIYDPPPTSGGLFSTNLRRDEPPESKWLLICAQAWRVPTSLLQLDVCSTTSDKQLFRDLRQSYLELKRAWWHRLSLKVVQSIRFVQFELHPSDLVDVRKVPDMPPVERHDEYLYQRVELIPPIGENLMTHWFHKPHKANDQATTFMRSPKKRKLRLAICPKMGTNIGWGIQLVEGWAMFKLWLLALVISFLGGMVFAVTWAVMKHDIQGAVAVAAYFVALAGLVVGTTQAYLH